VNERRAARGIWPRWLGVGVLLAALSVLILPKAGTIPGGIYSDIALAHLPQIFYLRRALLHWHTLPLWSPTYYSGYPFYADPLAEIWYPPAWLTVILPLPWGLWFTVGLHLLAGAVGMFALLRVLGRSRSAALLGALAWALLPKLWAHWNAGHLSLLFAVPWTPWLLLAVERRGRWLNTAAVWAFIFLADPRWAAYAGILWLGWEVRRWINAKAQRGNAETQRNAEAQRKQSTQRFFCVFCGLSVRSVFSSILVCFLPVLIASPLAVPLLHYSRLSTRVALTPRDVLLFSLAPWWLVGLVVPTVGWFHEWVIYLGAAPVLLALLAWMRGRARFWLWVALGAAFWSLGSYIPGMELVARLPLVNLLRVPPRAMFLCGFAFAVAAAAGLDLLLAEGKAALRGRMRLAIFAVVATAALLGFGLLFVAGKPRFAVMTVLVWLGAFGLLVADFPKSWRAPLWIAILLADLLAFDACAVQTTPFEEVFAVPSAVEEVAGQMTAPFRVYTPSYSVPQQAAAARGWELANGVDPLVLDSYANFMEKASGVPDEGYSVSIPPLKDGDLLSDAAYTPNADLLGLLNVKVVAAAFPIRAEGLELAARDSEVWVYRNLRAKPRVWLEQGDGSVTHNVRLDCWCPNRLRAHAIGAGVLVFSEVAYPGWKAFVDGKRVPLQTAHGILRAVPIPAGEHTVELRFRPWDLALGLLLGVLGLLAWLFGGKVNHG